MDVRFLSLSFVPSFSLYSMIKHASTHAIVWIDRCICVDTKARMKEIAFDRIAPPICCFAMLYCHFATVYKSKMKNG